MWTSFTIVLDILIGLFLVDYLPGVVFLNIISCKVGLAKFVR